MIAPFGRTRCYWPDRLPSGESSRMTARTYNYNAQSAMKCMSMCSSCIVNRVIAIYLASNVTVRFAELCGEVARNPVSKWASIGFEGDEETRTSG
jgi:hypothetical protein